MVQWGFVLGAIPGISFLTKFEDYTRSGVRERTSEIRRLACLSGALGQRSTQSFFAMGRSARKSKAKYGQGQERLDSLLVPWYIGTHDEGCRA
jgi:hypothetical protein